MLSIDTNFESGSIEFVSFDEEQRMLNVKLIKNRKNRTNHWFFFKIMGINDDFNLCLTNGYESIFKNGWNNYHPFISYDGYNWLRYDKCFKDVGGLISIPINIRKDFFFAWYEPYSITRLKKLVSHIESYNNVIVEEVNNFYSIKFINKHKPTILITARQHPGETMSSFFIEGFLTKIIDNSVESRTLLENFNFYIYPLVNIDGVIDGVHRTDMDGNDYNVSWTSSKISNIELIKNELNNNVVLFFDIHGDEVSKINYAYFIGKNIKTKQNKNLFDCFRINYPDLVLVPMPSLFKTFLKELFYNHKILNYSKINYHNEAIDYVIDKTNALSFVMELNAHKNSPEGCISLGKLFVQAIFSSNIKNKK